MIKVLICNNKVLSTYFPLGETEEKHGTEIAFGTSFIFNYYFEREQFLKFIVYEKNKEITEVITNVAKLTGSASNSLTIPLKESSSTSSEPYAQLVIDGNKNVKAKYKATLNTCLHITPSSSIRCEDYFYTVSNFNDNHNWRNVYKSEEFSINDDKQEFSNSFSMLTVQLCLNDKSRDIKIELHYVKKKEVVGESIFKINQIKKQVTDLPIINKCNKEIGYIQIDYNEKEYCSFLDYIKAGLEINFIVGIDYTKSNLPPDDKESLHYAYGNEPNDYEKAIIQCGNIVAYYDYDQLFPVYGFGGKTPGLSPTQHCFPVTLTSQAKVQGIPGVISAYRDSLSKVIQDGPTYFSDLLKTVVNIIKEEINLGTIKYYILMILTDGLINDMEETRNALVQASEYPLSVIIIGIGNADFGNMTELDGDVLPVTNKKEEKVKRDIVQFVPFNKFKKKASSSFNSNNDDLSILAEEVLKEVPKQVEEYFEINKNTKFSLLSN